MNIISFDIEEWFLEWAYLGNHKENYGKYDGFINQILDKLDERDIKATFFCLGGMARQFPQVIKLIQSRGHDMGCHSDKHLWLNKLTKEELLDDTRMAVDSLEQVLGQKIKSYRAPAFTIGDKNKYALEVLAECGIEQDASIFPAVHALGGFKQFNQNKPCIIKYNGIEIKEFPISTTNILGKDIAYSGGGYFRFFPLWFVEKAMKNHDYNMTYFHISDLVDVGRKWDKDTFESYYKIPATWKNMKLRQWKNTIGKGHSFVKLMQLIDETEFVNLAAADSLIDWQDVPVVYL